ncbi:MAG: N-acetylmuramoyl-L-alanine amidase [Patescibacteria group bacterium]
MKKITFLSVAFALALATGNFVAVAETNPLAGKIIALDAGHNDVEYGASNIIDEKLITEAEVNWDVVQALETKLKNTYGAYVVVAERFSTRRDRVNDAVAKCAALDVTGDGVADNKKCDVLVSVHHNGNTDPTHDGTLTIYTQNSDKPLAQALHDSLLPLTNQDEGMLNGGYGMTVYKNLVSTITEAYYITNDDEARLWLSGTRTPQEVDAQIAGLSNYFASQTGGKGGKPR